MLVSAATSRATPSTLMQSPRFGVRLTSRIVSSSPSAATSDCPVCSSGAQLQQAAGFVGKAKLARRAQHAERLDATQLRLLDLEVARQHRADHRERRLHAGSRVRRAADDLHALAVPVSTGHTLSLSASGCCYALEDVAHDDARQRRRRGQQRLRSRGRPSSGARRDPSLPATDRRSTHATIAD